MKALFAIFLVVVILSVFGSIFKSLAGVDSGPGPATAVPTALAQNGELSADPAKHEAWVKNELAKTERAHTMHAAVAALYGSLRNPSSLRLAYIGYGTKDSVCIQYRAQNGFGGMAIEYAIEHDNKLEAGDESDMAASWTKRCHTAEGIDGTELAVMQKQLDEYGRS